MPTDSAAQVRAILEETARRKQLWAQIQRIAKEAYEAVAAEAHKRGIRHQDWLGGLMDSQYVRVCFSDTWARFDAKMRVKHPRTGTHCFRLHGPGTVERPTKNDMYRGYPELYEDDLEAFRHAAVETLMASLNAYAARRDRYRG